MSRNVRGRCSLAVGRDGTTGVECVRRRVVLLYREIGVTLSSLLVLAREAASILPAWECMEGATAWVACLRAPAGSPQRVEALALSLSVIEEIRDFVEAASSSLRNALGTRWYDLTIPAAA
jgi:hypothetical protein